VIYHQWSCKMYATTRPNPDNQIAKLKEQVSWIKSYYCLSNMEGFWNEDSIIYSMLNPMKTFGS
jgi:hypothetical protein